MKGHLLLKMYKVLFINICLFSWMDYSWIAPVSKASLHDLSSNGVKFDHSTTLNNCQSTKEDKLHGSFPFCITQ